MISCARNATAKKCAACSPSLSAPQAAEKTAPTMTWMHRWAVVAVATAVAAVTEQGIVHVQQSQLPARRDRGYYYLHIGPPGSLDYACLLPWLAVHPRPPALLDAAIPHRAPVGHAPPTVYQTRAIK